VKNRKRLRSDRGGPKFGTAGEKSSKGKLEGNGLLSTAGEWQLQADLIQPREDPG
jgi:hypothetical protein